MPATAASSTKSATATGSHRSPSQEGTRSPKKLSEEELARSTQRLTGASRAEVKLKPLVESVKLSKSDEEKSVKRLYDEAVAAQKRKHTELEKRHEESSPKPTGVRALAQSEEQDAISRLYDKSIYHMQTVQAELEKKFVPELSNKKPDGTAQQDVNSRLYTDSMAKQKDGKSKLYDKYILDVEPKMAKRTKEELKASAAKLHSGDR
jgi:hypothetical protein